MIMKMAFVASALVWGMHVAAAGTEAGLPPTTQSDTLSFPIRFRIGSAVVDSSFAGNGITIKSLFNLLKAAPDSGRIMSCVDVVGASSPDGPEKGNLDLAARRARAVADYISENIPLKEDIVHEIHGGEDWEGLKELVEASGMAAREEVLSILDSSLSRDRRKTLLMYLEDSKPWLSMYEEFFPLLHKATVYVSFVGLPDGIPFERPDLYPELPILQEAPSEEMPDAVIPADSRARKEERSFRFALKTNTLYWAALLPNAEFEFYVGKRFSVNLEYQGAWWSDESRHKFYRLVNAGPEVRWWFAQRDRFHGHFAGAYGNGGFYEWMNGPDKGYQGNYIGGGLTYGYSFPLGKRLAMECSLGIGYVSVEYKRYHYDDGRYVYESTRRTSYIGPTKAKVALVWRFGANKAKK